MASKYTVDEVCGPHLIGVIDAIELLSVAADDETVDNVCFLVDEGYHWSQLREFVFDGDNLADLVDLRQNGWALKPRQWSLEVLRKYHPNVEIPYTLDEQMERFRASLREFVGVTWRAIITTIRR